MANFEKSITGCKDEILRLVKILCYQKTTDEDKEFIIKSLKCEIEAIEDMENTKAQLQEARRAERERRKYGIR